MRLIDADELKVYLQEYLHYEHAIPWVDAQPTAYDVEKVVAELEDAKFLMPPENDSHYSDDGLFLEDAIEIVRKGGVE